MEMRKLGDTGAEVSALSLGTWAMGGDEWGESRDQDSLDVLRAAVDGGVTLIDTADVYGSGHSEELIGEAVPAGWPGLVVTKVGWDIYSHPRVVGGSRRVYERSYIEHAFAESCRRLRRRSLDVYLLHNPGREDLEASEGLATLRELQRRGVVRWVGASVGTPDDALAALERDVDVLEVPLNAARSAMAHVLGEAASRGAGVIAREPLERGLLTGKYGPQATFPAGDHRREKGADWLATGQRAYTKVQQVAQEQGCSVLEAAIGYPLSYDQVATTTIGARSVDQLATNIAASRIRLTEAQRRFLEG